MSGSLWLSLLLKAGSDMGSLQQTQAGFVSGSCYLESLAVLLCSVSLCVSCPPVSFLQPDSAATPVEFRYVKLFVYMES